MPTLEQVMTPEVGADVFRASAAWSCRHREVVALRLATGAPCDGHAQAFAPWPGPEPGVLRWFQLDGGDAVAVAHGADHTPQVHLWTSAPDPS